MVIKLRVVCVLGMGKELAKKMEMMFMAEVDEGSMWLRGSNLLYGLGIDFSFEWHFSSMWVLGLFL
ncbi:hypothetical protein BDV35DRAFT_334802 [Aspergillus flavus]|uniref:Uncharacterized protein n=1 Tax=Aspergillus flavus TaxID=5059 RepID=A0A5N6HE37_ASPFL|nr:hypothetical protein BDV35DRAFT_334802 [Aspergillus flavus]